jgi:DNA-binding LacI/PurR family transcriptional regulator
MDRVTLKDVAARLGLSRAAVSMGLRGDPGIPVRTRKRIHAACQELGYRPDSLLSEMGSARWRRTRVAQGSRIAYVTTIPDGQPFWNLGQFVHNHAVALGYQVEIFERASFGSSAKLQRILRNRGITEVILGPVYDESLGVNLNWSKFISIQLLPVFHSPLHCVVRDHFNVVTMAWRKAASYGYRRIGCLLLDHQNQLADDVMRLSAVHTCQHYFFPKLPQLPPFLFNKLDTRRNEFADWVRLHQPDVIISFNSVHADYYLQEFGHDIPYASLHEAADSYSGVTDYTETCAREAINLLHYCRRSYQWGIPRERIDHVLEPVWHEGTSMPRKEDVVHS